MADLEFMASVVIDKRLPTVTSGNYVVSFASSTNDPYVTAPRLAVSIAGSGTASVDGVNASTIAVGTTAAELFCAYPFGTATDLRWVMLKENSGNTNASVVVRASTNNVQVFKIGAAGVAMFQAIESLQMSAIALSTGATGVLQVLTIGE